VHEIVELADAERSNALILGRVHRVHVLDGALDDQYLPRPEILDLVGRMGGGLWTHTRRTFLLRRPTWQRSRPTAVDLGNVRNRSA
jgi:hypothetical protein